jgi:pimeloyl-ACP methyl ester carboxylesterase
MKKVLLLLALLQTTALFCCGQQYVIPYGNNPAAGKYYKIRGINMYCEVYGEGKPVLMIHGNGGSIASFNETIPYFAKKYKVIAVDSRAHGKSIDNKDSLSFEMMADDFNALLDTLHIKKTYVIGWSDGAINTLVLAMRHQDKVIKLAATGANLWADSTAFIRSVWSDMTDQYNLSKDQKLVPNSGHGTLIEHHDDFNKNVDEFFSR